MVLQKSPCWTPQSFGKTVSIGTTIATLASTRTPWLLPKPFSGTFGGPGRVWNRAELGLAVSLDSVLLEAAGRFFSSVYSQFAGYLLGLFGHVVGPLEVLVSGGAAQPGLPEVDPASEEEAARSWFDATLQQRPDLTLAGQAAVSSEESVLLAKHPGAADLDHCCSKVLVFLH